VYRCQQISKEIELVNIPSAHFSTSSSPTGNPKLVVKVCDTSDEVKRNAAKHEAEIL
jgi:hypothetical protein